MGRRSKIDMSPHKSEIEYLMLDAQWGSLSVSKYLSLKYGEDIAASSLRTWRTRKLASLQRRNALPEKWQKADDGDSGSKARIKRILGDVDDVPDVISKRLQLARLQEARVQIDVENEFNIGKLFNSNSREIELLNKIYTEIKEDLQDLGVLPHKDTGPAVQVHAYGGQGGQAMAAALPGDTVPHTPLADAMSGVPADVLSRAGRTLVLLRSTDGTDGDVEEGSDE